MTADALRQQINALVDQFADLSLAPSPFVPGETIIPPSGKVIGARELGMWSGLDDRHFNYMGDRLGEFLGVSF